MGASVEFPGISAPIEEMGDSVKVSFADGSELVGNDKLMRAVGSTLLFPLLSEHAKFPG